MLFGGRTNEVGSWSTKIPEGSVIKVHFDLVIGGEFRITGHGYILVVGEFRAHLGSITIVV